MGRPEPGLLRQKPGAQEAGEQLGQAGREGPRASAKGAGPFLGANVRPQETCGQVEGFWPPGEGQMGA